MPQTELKVVRCPGCNTAYNAASLPPGKGFRCKKCSTVVGGSAPAPTPEPAQTKRPSSRIDRKASGSTSRRMKPEGRPERGEKPEKPASGRTRGGGTPEKKGPMLYIVGGVFLVAIIGLAAMSMGEEEKPKPKKTEEPANEQKRAEAPPDDDISKWDLGGKETDFAKQRKQGFKGQDKSKIDPITGQGTTDEQPQPPPEEPPEEPPAKDPLDEEADPEHKDQ